MKNKFFINFNYFVLKNKKSITINIIININLIVLNMSLAFINPFKNELFELFIFLQKNIETSVILIIIMIPNKLTIYI